MKFENKPNLPVEVEVTLGWWRTRPQDFPPEVYSLSEKFLNQKAVSLTDLGFDGAFTIVSKEVDYEMEINKTYFHLRRVGERGK
ncbi:MAG: hypothetical protein M0R74_17190 [Dehalococcoidia bacterium]|nr:hypothetical protein [Dehalococcoidia bacterium]